MKIGFIITALGYGGAEVLLKNLCNHLAGAHALYVLHLKPLNDLAPQFDARVDIRCAGLNRQTPVRIRQWASEVAPDVVNTHLGHADLLTMWALRESDIPLVVTLHNVFYKKDLRDQLFFRLYRYSLHKLHPHAQLTGVSPATLSHARHAYRLPEARCHYLPNAIPSDPFIFPGQKEARSALGWDRDAFVVLFVGRLSKQKAVHRLIEAAAHLKMKAEAQPVQIRLLGEGVLKPQLAQKVKELGLEDYVTFCGTSAAPHRYMAAADALVLPSLFEGLPTVVLEAFRQELPVIASEVDGNTDLIEHGKNGLLFQGEDTWALAEAILKLKTSPSLRERLGANGHQHFQEAYSIDRYAARLLHLSARLAKYPA